MKQIPNNQEEKHLSDTYLPTGTGKFGRKMRAVTLGSAFLAALILLQATAPILSQAYATCYANPIVGVNGATGVYMWITHGYIGGGLSLVTAYHVVQSGSVTVYTNCGSQSESIRYYNPTKDWAILTTNGITFANWYTQGDGSVGEGVGITPYSGTGQGHFSGTIYSMSYGNSYTMAICTQTNFGSGTSGSPVQDATQKVLGIALSKNTPGPGQCPGQQGWYFLLAYNGT